MAVSEGKPEQHDATIRRDQGVSHEQESYYISVMVAILLFAFGTAPPAQAIVPALTWAVWGIAAGVTSIAVLADETSDHEQAKADNQGQDVNDLAINQLPHPIEYYQLGSPTPAGYVHGVEVADMPCVEC